MNNKDHKLRMDDMSNGSLTNARLDGDIILTIINCSIFSFCAFFSIILNLVLIFGWYFYRSKNNYSDLIFISLAVSDFINGLIVCIGYLIIELKDVDPLLKTGLNSVDNAVYIINFLSLITLSYHRLRQLIKPYEEKATINRFRIFVIISIWIASLVISFLNFFISEYLVNSEFYSKLILILITLIFLDFPILSILILNILIIRNFKAKLDKKITKIKKINFKNEKNAIKCIVFMNTGILLTMGLWIIIYPFRLYNYEFALCFHELDAKITYFYSIVDPLIVFLFSKKIRKFFFRRNLT